MANVRHHALNGHKYEGPPSGAMVIRNRENDTKDFSLNVTENGEIKRTSTGAVVKRAWRLGAAIDEKVADSVNCKVLISKEDWLHLMQHDRTVQHWLNEGVIDAYSAT